MELRATAFVCAARNHAETGAVVRLMTRETGMIGAYVAGARGRTLRPVLIPGNRVEADIRSRIEGSMPSAKLELLESRGPWLGEPLASAAITWACSLTAAALPERHPYPALFDALGALLDAVCHAPSARGWAAALVGYEALLLRELGYEVPVQRPDPNDFPALLDALDRLAPRIARYPLADRRSDVMGARAVLRDRLGKIS
ncbi:DNA repair protein RecO C-terminal domain-containing protein [Novosphingobium sp. MW5]|nr:DNA repair protein RecO C-terminal domain-containing protein [Novosphingobium sp. MW5]